MCESQADSLNANRSQRFIHELDVVDHWHIVFPPHVNESGIRVHCDRHTCSDVSNIQFESATHADMKAGDGYATEHVPVHVPLDQVHRDVAKQSPCCVNMVQSL